jgi:hypothetical protein
MKHEVSTIIPSIAPETNDVALDRLFDPARFFDDPSEIIAATDLDLHEKRAILSSWASDACAVESMPVLRRPNGTSRPVTFDEIMDALRSLDSQAGQERPGTSHIATHQLDA